MTSCILSFCKCPYLKKQADELETHFDKWVYFLKNLENFDHLPAILNEPIFQKGFEIAELSHLKPKQFDGYQKSLLGYWAVKNVKDTAFGEGRMEGLIEGEKRGKMGVAKALKANNVALAIVMATTGLSEDESKKTKQTPRVHTAAC